MSTPIYTKPDYSGGIWAYEGDIGTPSSDKIAQGHVVERPPFEISNFIENRQDQGIAYLLQQGIADWDGNTSYPIGALIKRSGMIYRALSLNSSTDPTSNPTVWERAFYTFNEGKSVKDTVDNILNIDEYLPQYIAMSNPILIGRANGRGYLAEMGLPLSGFENLGYSFQDNHRDGIYHNGDSVVAVKDGVEVVAFKQALGFPEESNTVVTMAMLSAALRSHEIYIVGDIYVTTTPISPSTRFGYGTWERYGQGKVLVGFSDSNLTPNWTRSIGSIFGEYNHTLSIDEMPSHTHEGWVDGNWHSWRGGGSNISQAMCSYSTVTSTGGSQSHNNVQPSVVVYMWRRTA